MSPEIEGEKRRALRNILINTIDFPTDDCINNDVVYGNLDFQISRHLIREKSGISIIVNDHTYVER